MTLPSLTLMTPVTGPTASASSTDFGKTFHDRRRLRKHVHWDYRPPGPPQGGVDPRDPVGTARPGMEHPDLAHQHLLGPLTHRPGRP